MYIASLVLGILSLLFSWIPIINVIFSIVALIISIVSISEKKEDKNGKGMGIAGTILSSISLIVSILFCIAIAYLITVFPDILGVIQNEIKEEININEISWHAEAETMLISKYFQISIKNKNVEYTGYINIETEEYTNIQNGIEIDDYYEEYLEKNGYDCDVEVNKNGAPQIVED